MSAFIRRALILGTVVALAGVAGLLAAGGAPQDVERDLTAAEIPPPTTTSPTTTSTTTTSTTTTSTTTPPTSIPSTTSTSAVIPLTSTEPDEAATLASGPPTTTPEASETTTAPTTAPTATTSQRATTTAALGTTEPQTTDPEATTEPVESIVVVIANASNTFGLATQSVDDVQAFGYVFVITTDGEFETAESSIFFADGFEEAATRLAVQLGADPDIVAPLPAEQLFLGTAQPEVLLFLGNDWAGVTNLDD